MPRLSSEKINEIRQSVDIVDVIGEYLSLQTKHIKICLSGEIDIEGFLSSWKGHNAT